jgi:pectinesterase
MEFANTGPGADTTHRVDWGGVHVLHDPAQVAAKYTIDAFISGKEWIPHQIPYDHEVPSGRGVTIVN